MRDSQLILHIKETPRKQQKALIKITHALIMEGGPAPSSTFVRAGKAIRGGAARKQHGRTGSALHVSLMQVLPAKPAIIVPRKEDRELFRAVFGHGSMDTKTPCPLSHSHPPALSKAGISDGRDNWPEKEDLASNWMNESTMAR